MLTQRFVIRVLKLIFIVSTLSFVVIQIQLRKNAKLSEKTMAGPEISRKLSANPDSVAPHPPRETDRKPVKLSAEADADPAPADKRAAAVKLPENIEESDSGKFNGEAGLNDSLTTAEARRKFAKPTLEDIRKSIEFNNANTEVLNEDIFGPLSQVQTVLVVQVHNRSKYLDMLVQSLSKAKGIESSLLVFSHDFYSAEINRIVKNIKFCMVMQIFYPYSIQIFPSKFPGQDPLDCDRDISKAKAEAAQCQNWKYPDKYGHYRVAKFTQIKHHWWWKMNYVFDGIPKLHNFNGYVLLLEEDHFVSPDFLHVLNLIVNSKQELCKECSIISLGFYLKSYGLYGSHIAKLAVYPWFSSRHNLGMALNRDIWNKIRNCSQLFCTYDDYNWDWSLMKVNLQCIKPEKMTVVYAKAPRVFHIGDCGVHHVKCRADTSAQKYAGILDGVKDKLFPEKLEVSERSKRMLRPPKENGGWGDVRDHALCMNNTIWRHDRTTVK